MANTGQIVAALAGGSLLTICTMLFLRLRAYEERAAQRRRIDTAVDAILTGVETVRRGWPPDEDYPEATTGAEAEVHARAHLRLIVGQPPTKPGGRRDSQAPARSSSGVRPKRLGNRRR